MTGADVLGRLAAVGLRPFLADGERLRLRGRSDAYGEELRRLVGEHREEVVGFLKSEGTPPKMRSESDAVPLEDSRQSARTPAEVSRTDDRLDADSLLRAVADRLESEGEAPELLAAVRDGSARFAGEAAPVVVGGVVLDTDAAEPVAPWTCPKCGGGLFWESLAGSVRCTSCEPSRGPEIRREAERLRRPVQRFSTA